MTALLELFEPAKPRHPARYTQALFPTMARMLRGCQRILDPFAGTGGVFALHHWLPVGVEIDAVEIEPEWAAMDSRTTLGSALALPWPDNHFDAICTSPAYGNRMADKLIRDPRETQTYASDLGRVLHPDNGASLQWSLKYRDFHHQAWVETRRVLRPGGVFVLNIKDHIRKGKRQHVTNWHIATLASLGFEIVEHEHVPCPGMRRGQNGNERIEYESVVKLVLNSKPDALLCPFCGEPWPESVIVMPDGQLGCRCRVDTPAAPAKRIAMMHRRHGVTPGQTCGTCRHLTTQGRNRVYYKCQRYGVSSGSGTDWRLKWAACGLWIR